MPVLGVVQQNQQQESNTSLIGLLSGSLHTDVRLSTWLCMACTYTHMYAYKQRVFLTSSRAAWRTRRFATVSAVALLRALCVMFSMVMPSFWRHEIAVEAKQLKAWGMLEKHFELVDSLLTGQALRAGILCFRDTCLCLHTFACAYMCTLFSRTFVCMYVSCM